MTKQSQIETIKELIADQEEHVERLQKETDTIRDDMANGGGACAFYDYHKSLEPLEEAREELGELLEELRSLEEGESA